MKKKKRFEKKTGIIIAAGIIAAVIFIILIVNGVRRSEENAKIKNTARDSETESVDVIPYGDNESDSYDFSGDYFDTATNKGTMTIEKRTGGYNIEITYSEDRDSLFVWIMTASYDKKRKALRYDDAKRTDYTFDLTSSDEERDEENTLSRKEEYTEGTGYIYLSGGNFFWIDDMDDMGAGVMFQRVENED